VTDFAAILEQLSSRGHLLPQTRLGPVDVMGSVVGGKGHAELREASRELDLGSDRSVRVLGLAELIAIKEQLGREKDRAVLPLLRRTLREEQG
jgi:hypothetical protein